MWAREQIELRILDMWCDGWSVDRIVEKLLTTEGYQLDPYWQKAMQDGWDMRPGVRRDVIEHLQSHGLCDSTGRSKPTIPSDMMVQIIYLEKYLTTDQIAHKLQVSGALGSSYTRMSPDDSLRALLHATNIHKVHAKAALWDATFRQQSHINGCLDEVIVIGFDRDVQRRMSLRERFEHFEFPFAADFGPYGKSKPAQDDKDENRTRNGRYRSRSDPFFGFSTVVDDENNVMWREDSDGEVVMEGTMPPWGYANLNEQPGAQFCLPDLQAWPKR